MIDAVVGLLKSIGVIFQLIINTFTDALNFISTLPSYLNFIVTYISMIPSYISVTLSAMISYVVFRQAYAWVRGNV